MPTPLPSKPLRALCHEHHVEMRITQVRTLGDGPPTQTSAYACPVPECAVHYNDSNGYFLVPREGGAEPDKMPRVTCPRDGQPMYLREVNPEKRAFRLWQCPRCDSSRTNEENLVRDFA